MAAVRADHIFSHKHKATWKWNQTELSKPSLTDVLPTARFHFPKIPQPPQAVLTRDQVLTHVRL